MSSPYTTATLSEREGTRTAPSAHAASLPVQPPPYYAPAPAPMPYPVAMPQQQPVYVQSPRKGGGKAESAALALMVLVVVVLAAAAGFMMSRNAAPTPAEMNAYQAIANREGAFSGRLDGYSQGKAFGTAEKKTIAIYKGKIAGMRTRNSAFNQARREMSSLYGSRRAPYSGYGGYYGNRGYRGYNYGGSSSQVSSALASAQSLANMTGQAVDVEIY